MYGGFRINNEYRKILEQMGSYFYVAKAMLMIKKKPIWKDRSVAKSSILSELGF